MLNKIYSILMSGVSVSVTNDTQRTRTSIEYQGLPIISNADEDTRNYWAEGILRAAEFSRLYPKVLELDPENTYRIQHNPRKQCDMRLPDESDIRLVSKYIPKNIRDSADTGNPFDCAALFCIAVCNRYTNG